MKDTLFSVVVITYNSSKYVIETLESIKTQLYQNIELIVSDDCSVDNTVEICRQWLKNNKDFFVNTKLIINPVNTGIPANCNRGIKASTGEWVKIIAGDDILKSTAIEDYANYINATKSPLHIVFSRIATFENDVEEAKEMFNSKISNYVLFHPKLTQRDQTKLFCRGQLIKIITMVFSKEMFDDVSGFDEQYPLREDKPFIYKILNRGYSLHFMNKLTFYYRQHNESIIHVKNSRKQELKIKLENVWAPQIKYRFQNLSLIEKKLRQCYYFRDKAEFDFLNNPKKYKFVSISFNVLWSLLKRLNIYVVSKGVSRYTRSTKSFTYKEILNN